MIKARCMVERRRHKHYIFMGKTQAFGKGFLREDDVVMGKKNGLRATCGTRGGKNKNYFIRRAAWSVGVRFVFFVDIIKGNGAVRFNGFVMNGDCVLGKSRNAINNGKNLILEVSLMMECWTHKSF